MPRQRGPRDVLARARRSAGGVMRFKMRVVRPRSAELHRKTIVYAFDGCGSNGARRRLGQICAPFAEAVTVLDDDFALTRDDPDPDDGARFVTLGLSDVGNLLVVVYTFREPNTVRMISAWKANRHQRVFYEKSRG